MRRIAHALLQAGWEPTATPALWGRVPEEYHEHHEHHEQRHDSGGYNAPPPQQPGTLLGFGEVPRR